MRAYSIPNLSLLLWRLIDRKTRTLLLSGSILRLLIIPLEYFLVVKLNALINDSVNQSSISKEIQAAVWAVIAASLSLLVIRLIAIRVTRIFISRACNRINIAMIDVLWHNAVRSYPNVAYSDILQKSVIAVGQLNKGFINPLLLCFTSLFTILGLLLGLLRVLPPYAFTTLIPLALISITYNKLHSSRMKESSKRLQLSYTALIENINFTFGSIPEINSTNSFDKFLAKINSVDKSLRNSEESITTISASSRPILEFFGIVTIFIVAVTVYAIENNIGESFSIAATFSLVLQRILPQVTSVTSYTNKMKGSHSYTHQMFDLIQSAFNMSTKTLLVRQQGIDKNITQDHDVVYHNVTHDPTLLYPLIIESESLAFSSLSTINEKPVSLSRISINRNDKVAIIGPSGSGKTSLAISAYKHLMSTASIPLIEAESKVYFSQSLGKILDASILANITLEPAASEINIMRALDAARCACLFDGLLLSNLPDPGQLQKKVNATQLSLGQIQRITIARAIYSDSEILILDEPLSNINKEIAKTITSNLLSINRTVVLVTHDTDLIQEFAHIISVHRKNLCTRDQL